jgi:hypothetical protein
VTSTSIIISTGTILLTDQVTGLADPVDRADRAGSVDLADPVALEVLVGSVDLVDLADPVELAELADRVDPEVLAGSVVLAGRANPGDQAGLVGLLALAGRARVDLPGSLNLREADLAAASGSTDQSIEEMLPMEIDRQPTSSVAGLKGSPRGEQLVGLVPELVPAAELNRVGLEEVVRFPLAPRVGPRPAPAAEVAPGHQHAQLPAVEGTG